MKHSLPRFFSNDPSKTLFIRLPPCFSYTTFYTRNYRIIVVRAWCNISHRQLEHRLLIVLSREISDYRLHGRSNVTLASYTHVSRSVKIFHCARKSWFLVGRVNGKKKKKKERRRGRVEEEGEGPFTPFTYLQHCLKDCNAWHISVKVNVSGILPEGMPKVSRKFNK